MTINVNEFYEMIKHNDLEVTFTKRSGETRVMKCTINVPELRDKAPVEMPEHAFGYGAFTVYDTEEKGFRRIIVENVISVKPLDTRFGLLQE